MWRKDLLNLLEAEQGWGNIESDPESVSDEVARVSEEDVDGAEDDRQWQRPQNLDGDHHGESEHPRGQPVRVDDVEGKERNQTKQEARCACSDRRERQYDLREGDLAHHLVSRPNRFGCCGERRGEPAPRKDGRKEEERKVCLRTIENDPNKEVVDCELHGGVNHEPEVPDQRIAAVLPYTRDGQVEEQAAPLVDAAQGLDDRPKRTLPWAPHGEAKRIGCHRGGRIALNPYNNRDMPRDSRGGPA